MIQKKRINPLFVFGNSTDVGIVREQNEDYYGYFSTPLGDVFVVCDGMGGHNGGEVASRLAVETIHSFFKTTMPSSPEKLLKFSIEKANTAIWNMALGNAELSGMGTTVVILFFPKDKTTAAYVAHVGDSRIYRIRNNTITRLTEDHSKVMMLVKLGIITLEEAATHPQKNIITRALGIDSSVDVEINQIEVNKSDRYILCSDGITDLLSDSDILSLSEKNDVQHFAEELIQTANDRGGHDNSTVQVIDIQGSSAITWPIKNAKVKNIAKSFTKIKTSKRIALLAIPVALLLIALIVLSTGNSIDLASEHSEAEYIEGNEPAYIITITTDAVNTIEFENTSIIKATDSTFTIEAMDLNSSPNKTTLYYTISRGEDQRLDSLTIQNNFEQAYPEYNFIPPSQEPKTHIILEISTQLNNRVRCDLLEIDTIQTQDTLQLSLSIKTLRALFPEGNNETITIIDSIRITGNSILPYSEQILYEYPLPEIWVNMTSNILPVTGTTVPNTRISLIGTEHEIMSDSSGNFTVTNEGINGIDSLELVFNHPCYRRTSRQVEVLEERMIEISGYGENRAFKDKQTALRWLLGPDRNMTFEEAITWREEQDTSWRFPTEEELKNLPDNFLSEHFLGTHLFMDGADSTLVRVYLFKEGVVEANISYHFNRSRNILVN